MLRHIVEVMIVVEGQQSWARVVRDRRSKQGLRLPSVRIIGGDDSANKDYGGGSSDTSDAELQNLMRVLVEEVDKEVMRLIVSFI